MKKWSKQIGGAAIFVVAILVYLNSLGGAFISDDHPLILNHPYTKHLRDFPAIFTAGHYAGNGSYRPLTTSSFALNYQLSGANPASYHLVNILLHATVSLLVYLLCLRLFRALSVSLVAGFLFAVHPIHTEAVAWISGRAELLAALFSLAAWLFYLHGTASETRRRGAFIASLVLFFGALLSKENALMLPLVMAAADIFRARRDGDRLLMLPWLKRYLPFAGVIVFYLLFRHALYARPLLPGGGQVAFYDNPLAAAPLGARLPTALKILGEYFRLLVWPRHLSADYSFNAIPVVHTLADAQVEFALALIAILLLVSAISFLRRGNLWLPIAFAVITIAPTANLFFPIGTIKAERLLYLPSIGFCIAVALIFRWLYAQLRVPAGRVVLIGVVVLSLMILSVRAMQRNLVWQSERTLWAATAKTVPENFRAQMLLAAEALRTGDYATALDASRRAHAIDPSSHAAALNYGVALVQAGEVAEAMQFYEREIAQHPERADLHQNLGLAYVARGDVISAAEEFRTALKLNPRSAVAYLNLGLASSRMGETENALQNYRRATEVKPDYAEAWNALGALALKLGRREEARVALTRALALRPDYHDARFNLDLLNNP
ncbi:MAG: tetratricopeptide repeat protein [Verrucomicrobiota bacterium]|nr:tetratricopeptide repeat protein [Verrucomicrobiota bacterium]